MPSEAHNYYCLELACFYTQQPYAVLAAVYIYMLPTKNSYNASECMAWSRKLAYDAHLVMSYNLPYLIVLLQFTVQTNYIASELNALTVAQATPRLVILSHA